MPEMTGKREAHKRATRAALQDAADRLFAEKGIGSTTVREIAEAAGVTERTFFRYFAGKHEIVVPRLVAWTGQLSLLIQERPRGEPPILAVEHALAQIRAGGPFARLFDDGLPESRKLGPGVVALMAQAEAQLIDALRPRVVAPAGADPELLTGVLARCIVAAARSAAIRDWQLRTDGVEDRPTFAQQVDAAFALLRCLEPPAS